VRVNGRWRPALQAVLLGAGKKQEERVARSTLLQLERTLHHATRFVEEMRSDLIRAARDGADLPPRIRSVHEAPGHTTPEFRTLNIPIPDGLGVMPVDVLSIAIAHYAHRKRPDRIIMAMEAEMDGGPVLIAEARDRAGSRLFWVQPFTRGDDGIEWGEPIGGGWRDPGEQEMILDGSFANLPPVAVPARRGSPPAPKTMPQLTAH
jgi:hypothetical protein